MVSRVFLGEHLRLVVFGCILLCLVDAVLTLRFITLDHIKSFETDIDAADNLFREVLSPQSILYTDFALLRSGRHYNGSITPFSSHELLGDVQCSPAKRLHDPGLGTVFSSNAPRWLPRLARGPSIPLTPPLEESNSRSRSDEEDEVLAITEARDVDEESIRGLSRNLGQEHQRQQGQLQQQDQAQPQQGNMEEQPQYGVRAVDPPPPELDTNEALIVGRLASIAYCSHPDLLEAWNCSRCGAVPGFVPHRIVYDTVWDLAAYAGYYAPWNAVLLSFRGTDSSNWGQWAENMRAWRTDHMYPVPDFPHALIHAGFYTLWTGSILQATFTTAVSELMAAHPDARLVVTGHSMGGALAQLAGLEFKLFYNSTRTTVYTFGAPRVGNLAYQQLFNSFIDISWRFTHNRDIVPSVPLQLMGFQHVAREVWEVDVEDPGGSSGGVQRKLLLCDATGEDPSCHNSACYLGLCTSIADHLVYLGLHMYQDSDEC